MNILIVDDHDIVTCGLKSQLSTMLPDADFDIFSNGKSALDILNKKKHDLYILDLELTDITGLELIKIIREKYHQALILVNTMHEEIWYIRELKELNVDGVLFKSTCSENINQAVSVIMEGGSFFCERFKELNNKQNNNYLLSETFSKNEIDILLLIAKGHTTKVIADKKALSEKAIEHYRKRLFEKFEVSNVSRLIALAIKEGFIKKEDI
ncbi:MAG: response regulator transcription factor [Tannerella sp.]|jgi:DNA-binding NarL/FixJ family response regulator|nr:response regulator transcription factor [Tannerella sp.]